MMGAFQSYFRLVSIYNRKLMFVWPGLSFVGLKDRLHGARDSNPLRRLVSNRARVQGRRPDSDIDLAYGVFRCLQMVPTTRKKPFKGGPPQPCVTQS
jgi:hypothetical protein